MHLKRNEVPKIWPVERKGTKFVAMPKHGFKNSIPLVVAIRDILNFAETRKEAEKILDSGKVKVNGLVIKEDSYPLTLFDNMSLENKSYKLVLNNKKYGLEGINSKDSEKKIVKVIGKCLVKDKKTQINLSDGRNYISKDKISVNDSVIVDMKEKKIVDILQLKKGSQVLFIKGKHLGHKGLIENIEDKNAVIKIEDKKINANVESVMVIK